MPDLKCWYRVHSVFHGRIAVNISIPVFVHLFMIPSRVFSELSINWTALHVKKSQRSVSINAICQCHHVCAFWWWVTLEL